MAIRRPPSAARRVQVLRLLVRLEITGASWGGAPTARPEAGPEPAAGAAARSFSIEPGGSRHRPWVKVCCRNLSHRARRAVGRSPFEAQVGDGWPTSARAIA